MKKFILSALLLISVLSFGEDWYSSREKIENPKHQAASKDTVWYDYTDDPAYIYIWTLRNERATYFNLNDFGFEYPVKLNGLSAYLRDSLQTFSYKIYDKDGSTVLFEYEQPSCLFGDNDLIFETPMIMTDDFWFSILPQEDGKPKQATTEEVTSYHSYYGTPGNWQPFYKDTERYEWLNYVALEEYTDEDTYPPIVRSVSGLENFMGYDAQISVTVEDKSGMAAGSMTGQYNIGAGWIDFQLNTVKGDYVYNGTIPGQPNGTSGSIRFYMEDAVGNAQWSDEYPVEWGTDIPILSEGFENEFPPAGWTVQGVGAGFTRGELADGGFVYEGRWSAVHWDDSGTQNDWLITKPFTLPSEMPATLSFWQNTFWSYYYSMSEVCVSTDMVNWTQVYMPPYEPDNAELEALYDNNWIPARCSLGDYKGQTVYVGFHYEGDFNHQWYIDNVEVVIDNDKPEINNIYANTALIPVTGAYLNNPMDISLEVYDFTGIGSVVGHYTFDGGSNYTDLVFSATKADELWTATIPASPVELSGEIYFTVGDTGGVTGDTDPYPISFVADTGNPVITEFSYGDPVFIGDEMTIEITFEDESGISAVQGYYSKDDWANEVPVTMTKSKIHEYSYSGTIPAEAEETFGEVRFVITDVPGNVLNTDPYEVKWLEGYVLFYDDFDGSNTEETWYTDGGTWGYVTYESHSPVTSLHDSPGGNYGDNLFSPVRTRIFDFSSAYGATLYMWAKVDLETDWDFTYLQATTDETTWIDLYKFNGEGQDWKFYEINLGALALQPSVRLRFRLVTDSNTNFDGMYIDDVTLALFTQDYSSPMIAYEGPEVFTATDYVIPREFTIPVGLDDYTFSVDLTDISDISEVKVVYTVDGGGDQVSIPAVSSGPTGTYELTIPAQPAGSKVVYKVVATDNSSYKNVAETDTYLIRFGNFLCYQNGDDYTDYLDIIGNTPQASAQAVAKRITMGPMDGKDHYKADLVGITIDNYIRTEDGYPSDPMYVHVWEDAGGKPGDDLISPIYTEQAATDLSSYEITYVDLRPYADKLSNVEGDLFVGYTSAGDVTNILYEVAANHLSVSGYVKFDRSWLGMGDLSALSWELDAASVYHISAVIGEYSYVDAPLPPAGLTGKADIDLGTVELNWLANTEPDMDHYNVYRGDSDDFAVVTPIAAVPAADPTTYTDTPAGGGDAQGNYYYRLTAVDSDGNESTPSKVLMLNPTGIEENLPLVTKLYKNYPNPFNPSTTIKFSLSANSSVNLVIYNVKGEMVANLVNGNLKRGFYNLKFDGSNFTSGVYYSVLKVNEKTMTEKMMLIK